MAPQRHYNPLATRGKRGVALSETALASRGQNTAIRTWAQTQPAATAAPKATPVVIMILDPEGTHEIQFRSLRVPDGVRLPVHSVYVTSLIVPQGPPVSVVHGPLPRLCARFLCSRGYVAVIEAPTQGDLEQGWWACQAPVLPLASDTNSLFEMPGVLWWRYGNGGPDGQGGAEPGV